MSKFSDELSLMKFDGHNELDRRLYNYNHLVGKFGDWEPPKPKVVIPQFVADYIEEAKSYGKGWWRLLEDDKNDYLRSYSDASAMWESIFKEPSQELEDYTFGLTEFADELCMRRNTILSYVNPLTRKFVEVVG